MLLQARSKSKYVKVRVEDLDEAGQAFAVQWQQNSTAILDYSLGDAYTPPTADGSPEVAAAAAAAAVGSADADAKLDKGEGTTMDMDDGEESEVRRPTLEDVRFVLDQAKTITAHMVDEARLMTLMDDSEEWLLRSEQLALSVRVSALVAHLPPLPFKYQHAETPGSACRARLPGSGPSRSSRRSSRWSTWPARSACRSEQRHRAHRTHCTHAQLACSAHDRGSPCASTAIGSPADS